MTNDYVENPDQRILQCLAGLAAHHGKVWCMPNYKTIKALLLQRYHFCISQRSIARHIGALEEQQYLVRQRRHRRGKDGKLELHSTVYTLKAKTYAALGQMAGVLNLCKIKPWLNRWVKPLITATFSTAETSSKYVNTSFIIDRTDKIAQDSRKRE